MITVSKKAVASLATAFLCFSLTIGFAVGQSTPDFEDVPTGHIAERAIHWAAANGITAGVGNNRFGLGQTLTRYEMVTFLCRSFDPVACGAGTKGSDTFVDLPADHWANFSVGWAVEKGITSGISTNQFGGVGTLTREQMVTFLYRAKGSPIGGPTGNDAFTDAPTDPDHWANPPIGWAYQQGITGGVSAGVFGYGTTLSREEMVLFLCRAVAPDICAPSQSPLPSSVSTTTTTTTAPPKGANCDFPDHAARISEAVFQVHTGDSIGTAFYIGNDEWLTAAHVVGGQRSVTLRRGGISVTAGVVGINQVSDLALLQAEAGTIRPLQFGKLSDIGPGHPVFSVGFPFSVAPQPSVTSGVLSRFESHPALGTLVVTDAAISPGNSGGPLLNKCGEVIGLVVSKIAHVEVEGISYAVAETTIAQRLPDLRSATPDDVSVSGDAGDWIHFTGEGIDGKYKGYALGAAEHSGFTWEQSPTLLVRCGLSSSNWHSIFIGTDWLIQSAEGDNGEVIVEYRFGNMENLVAEWWWSNEKFESAIFADETFTEFASRLRSAGNGSLWVRIWDGFSNESYSMRFEIDGAVSMLNDLDCW
ncbi:MAG: trypsin-like serine protease [Acidimicrobiia bacterium]|nr:trypsin-like serine protease [Acidimicrobiia bacterium]